MTIQDRIKNVKFIAGKIAFGFIYSWLSLNHYIYVKN